MKLGKPSKRAAVFGLSGVLILAIVGLLVVYGSSMWPKQQAPSDKNKSSTSQGNVKAETAAPAKIETTKNSLNNNQEAKTLNTFIAIKTKEQGDCTLTLSNSKNTYTAHNSSKGLNAVGCPEWHVSTDGMEKGEYDLTVEFNGTKDHAVVKQKITL